MSDQTPTMYHVIAPDTVHEFRSAAVEMLAPTPPVDGLRNVPLAVIGGTIDVETDTEHAVTLLLTGGQPDADAAHYFAAVFEAAADVLHRYAHGEPSADAPTGDQPPAAQQHQDGGRA